MSAEQATLPDLNTLHERHFGLTPAVCANYAEAAAVCLSRHFAPPQTLAVQSGSYGHPEALRQVDWKPASAREKLAWQNQDDATRDGAYAIALAVVESELELFVYSRAKRGRAPTSTWEFERTPPNPEIWKQLSGWRFLASMRERVLTCAAG